MPHPHVVRRRFAVQGLVPPRFADPAAAVVSLTAVQSQELADAFVSVALRVRGGVDSDVRAAYERGELLRTHVLRPTWHLVVPGDLRWLLAATAERVRRLNGAVDRQHGVDDVLAGRAQEVFAAALTGGVHLTRAQLAHALSAARIEASGIRLAYLVMRAELDGLLCSGVSTGRQQTYALLAERAPGPEVTDVAAAQVELARRFFAGHGPASVADLARWSSLTLGQARAAHDAVRPGLVGEVVDGVELWWSADGPGADDGTEDDLALFLPGFDEGWAAFRDVGLGASEVLRTAVLDYRWYRPVVVGDADGCEVVGLWRRDVTARGIDVHLQHPPTRRVRARLAGAVARYAAATGRPVTLA